jgi:ferredoxin/flavodoxin
MKGKLFYFSTTGNTKLICELIRRKIKNIVIDIQDITGCIPGNAEENDIVGFACFTDEFRIPEYMRSFIGKAGTTKNTFAFIFNTFGSLSGKTLLDLRNTVTKSGYRVIDGISVHVPENYPPMIKKGLGSPGAPSEKDLKKLDDFIARLDGLIDKLIVKKKYEKESLKIGLKQKLIPDFPRFISKTELGKMECVLDRCVKCGICEKGCPARAIAMNGYPVFDHSKCSKCWKCYNLCPKKAVRSSRFGEGFYYNENNDTFKNYKHKIGSL